MFLASLLLAVFILPRPLAAQTDIEASRKRLEEIRRERDRLQQQQERLQGQVHDVHRPVVAVCRCGLTQRPPWCDATDKVAARAVRDSA